ncbi:MAG: glycoside hydrolase family 127 protein [Clostridia bacterium]|nr:glycoside hydrolase family 127 protein [Clostridia bacterium]
MKYFTYKETALTGGFLYEKEHLNRDVTIHAVYDRFDETGRIGAFRFESDKADIFWDSDVAKWMEGASYILAKHPNVELEQKVETLIDLIEKNQGEDGYFNIHYTVQEPDGRWTKRPNHELYCAGHLFEAAIAYADATGKDRFLKCMEKYADYIYKIFVEDDSAMFSTPGHEEIELALVRMYRYTGKKKYLDLAAHFINRRGVAEKDGHSSYDQSHLPVREQTEAVGHAVRAVYLYSAMADLALELEDEALKKACKALYEDIINHKMYITGGIGSCHLGETFSKPYDLPNGEAYTETCAGIGLMFFCQRMLALEHHASYADTIERVLYNGLLSGLSLDGKAFFYENPLEITMLDHFSNEYGRRRFPITQRREAFSCSCCPPNINRLFPRLAEYIYGLDGDTLYINQFASSQLNADGIQVETETNYPVNGNIRIRAEGVKKIAVRIPSWCAAYDLPVPHTLKNGYAVIENCTEFVLNLDMIPFAIRSNPHVVKDSGRLCIQAGPIVYCAESVDNGENLHAFAIPATFDYIMQFDKTLGLNTLTIDAFRYPDTENKLYIRAADAPKLSPAKLKLIPYYAFANRGESDMLVWFNEKI